MKASSLTVRIHHGYRNAWMGPEYWREYSGRPPLIYVDRETYSAPRGYFPVYRSVYRFDWTYADWYAWPFAKAAVLATDLYWHGLKWLITKRVLRLTSGPAYTVRWRDVRLQLRRCACYRQSQCLKHGGARELP